MSDLHKDMNLGRYNKIKTPFMKKLLVFVSFCVFSCSCLAGNDMIVKKRSIVKSYPVLKGDKLLLQNGSGNVYVKTWNRNEVKVEVVMSAYAQLAGEADEMLDQTTVTNEKTAGSNIISFCTHTFDSTVLGLDKDTIITRLNVVYNVSMPVTMDVHITNTSGNVYLEEITGSVSVDIVNGDLHAAKIGGRNNKINVEMGLRGTTISELNSAWVMGTNSNFVIGRANDVSIIEAENVSIGRCVNCRIYKTYGALNIDTADGLKGRMARTKVNLRNVFGSTNLELRSCDTTRIGNIICKNGDVITLNVFGGNVKAHINEIPGYNLQIKHLNSKIGGIGLPRNFGDFSLNIGQPSRSHAIKKGSVGMGGYVCFDLSQTNLELD